MAIVSTGRPAITRYRVVTAYKRATLVEVRPRTGRTHQIRVHLASVGHPVVGDAVYGRSVSGLSRQFLHAHRLAFLHPATEEPVRFAAELPDDLGTYLDRLQPLQRGFLDHDGSRIRTYEKSPPQGWQPCNHVLLLFVHSPFAAARPNTAVATSAITGPVGILAWKERYMPTTADSMPISAPMTMTPTKRLASRNPVAAGVMSIAMTRTIPAA